MMRVICWRIVHHPLLLTLTVLMPGVGMAQNVSVTDYRVPTSVADRLLIDFSVNHAVQGSNTTASKGNIGGVYKKFYDSLPFAYFIDIIGSGVANKNVVADAYETDYRLDSAARVQKYLLPTGRIFNDLFASLRLDANTAKGFDQPASAVTIGVGYGRFIEATPLAKAVRIEHFLIQEGEIRGRLPKAAILKLSDIIARREEYENRYGDIFKKEWYAAMETVIREVGLLTGNAIGAIGVLRIDEVIERERIADRFYGWDITLGGKFDITLSDDARERPPGSLDVSINYARPINWQWQLSERLSMNTPFDQFGTAFLASLSSDISYELSNRVDFRFRHLIRVDKPDGEDSQMSNSLGLSLVYYIENRINLVATEQIEKSPGKNATTNFTITLSYRIF